MQLQSDLNPCLNIVQTPALTEFTYNEQAAVSLLYECVELDIWWQSGKRA